MKREREVKKTTAVNPGEHALCFGVLIAGTLLLSVGSVLWTTLPPKDDTTTWSGTDSGLVLALVVVPLAGLVLLSTAFGWIRNAFERVAAYDTLGLQQGAFDTLLEKCASDFDATCRHQTRILSGQILHGDTKINGDEFDGEVFDSLRTHAQKMEGALAKTKKRFWDVRKAVELLGFDVRGTSYRDYLPAEFDPTLPAKHLDEPSTVLASGASVE